MFFSTYHEIRAIRKESDDFKKIIMYHLRETTNKEKGQCEIFEFWHKCLWITSTTRNIIWFTPLLSKMRLRRQRDGGNWLHQLQGLWQTCSWGTQVYCIIRRSSSIGRAELMYVQVIREMTDGGVDYSFECTGMNDVLREAFVSTHDVRCTCTFSGRLATAQPIRPSTVSVLVWSLMKLYAGLGSDGGARDSCDAQDDAAAPNGALRRPPDHRLRLRRLQGKVPAAGSRRQVHQWGTTSFAPIASSAVKSCLQHRFLPKK